MKKIISILLVLILAVSLMACGKNTDTEKPVTSETVVDDNKTDIEETENKKDNVKEPEVSEDKKSEEKPAENPSKVEESKPVEKPTASKPAEKPAESKPAEKPIEKPAEKPAESKPATLGNKLLAAFKSNASSKSGEELANAIVSIPDVQFSPVVMPVEEGLLTGFGNTEIKGFKSGVLFAPMIGSIAFIGYVFELESSANVSSFISTLRANANPRWNVCTEADEMITGSSGNKVFFVMCPTVMED